MTDFSKKKTTWSYKLLENKREPFEDKLLKNCSTIELEAKIEFLEKNVSLIQSECEALEMYVVKIQPEFLEKGEIDVSWIPYECNIKKLKFANVVPKVMNLPRKHSIAKSILNASLFTIVQRAIVVKKITLKHMIGVVERQILNMNTDFDKYFNKLIKECRRIDNEIESYDVQYQKKLRYAEDYKSEILEKAYNKVTKKIPASKYRQFIKKCMTKDTLLITKIRLQISIMTDEYRNLKLKISSMPNLKNKKTDAEVKLCKLMYLKQKRQLWEQLEIKKSIAEKLKNINEDFIKKKSEMKQYSSNTNLLSLDNQIRQLRFKIKKQRSPQKLTEESDDDLFQDDENDEVISDDLLKHYLELISEIEESNKEIKSLQNRVHRQNLTIHLHYDNIRRYLKLKKLNYIDCECTLEDNSIENKEPQDQLSVEDYILTEFHKPTYI